MQVMKQIAITSNSIPTALFLSFDLMELDSYTREANTAFRSVRSLPQYGSDLHKPRHMKKVSFSHVDVPGLSFVDNHGTVVEQAADFFQTPVPELHIAIPDNDEHFHIIFEWHSQKASEKWQAEYICSRKEAAELWQKS